ncbi:MAG: methyltransferase domain-containing protein [Burkholderiales bacterium]
MSHRPLAVYCLSPCRNVCDFQATVRHPLAGGVRRELVLAIFRNLRHFCHPLTDRRLKVGGAVFCAKRDIAQGSEHGTQPVVCGIESLTYLRRRCLERAAFDIVKEHGVRHHIQDPQSVVREFACVLAPGGLAKTTLFDVSRDRLALHLHGGDIEYIRIFRIEGQAIVIDDIASVPFVATLNRRRSYSNWYGKRLWSAQRLAPPRIELSKIEFDAPTLLA